jgi:hypothetical protein
MITVAYKFQYHPEWDCAEEVDNRLFSPEGEELDAIEIASLINSKKLKVFSHPKKTGISLADFKQRATIINPKNLTLTIC